MKNCTHIQFFRRRMRVIFLILKTFKGEKMVTMIMNNSTRRGHHKTKSIMKIKK